MKNFLILMSVFTLNSVSARADDNSVAQTIRSVLQNGVNAGKDDADCFVSLINLPGDDYNKPGLQIDVVKKSTSEVLVRAVFQGHNGSGSLQASSSSIFGTIKLNFTLDEGAKQSFTFKTKKKIFTLSNGSQSASCNLQ